MLKNIKGSLSRVIQEYLWPIKSDELRVFLPMAVLLAALLFNFATLRSIKDSIILPKLGAEVISFIKLWFVFPSSIIFTIIYFKLSNKFDINGLFLIVISFFLFIIFVFGFFIFPNQEYFHIDEKKLSIISDAYPSLYWYIQIIGKWSYTVIYVFSELWGVILIQLLYWQFANHFFSTEQAKRIYPILNLVANLGLIFAGFIIVSSGKEEMVKIFMYLGIIENNNLSSQNSIKLLTIFTILVGLVAIIFFKISLKNLISYTAKSNSKIIPKKSRTKLSLKESIYLILHSKYIGYLIIMIMSYGLAVNLIEGPWKAKVSELYPTTREYLNFTGNFNIALGIFGIVGSIFVSNLVRKASWGIAAMSVPLIVGVWGITLFLFIIISNIYDNKTIFGFSFIYLAVFIGSVQNIISKSTKYSLFDSTKELAYITLPLELRTKGKAAVDIIGAKFGKSLGAIIQSVAFTIIPGSSFESFYVYLALIFTTVILIWMFSVHKLSIEYKILTKE
jgi:AAA family ATP:ADP antiporter